MSRNPERKADLRNMIKPWGKRLAIDTRDGSSFQAHGIFERGPRRSDIDFEQATSVQIDGDDPWLLVTAEQFETVAPGDLVGIFETGEKFRVVSIAPEDTDARLLVVQLVEQEKP